MNQWETLLNIADIHAMRIRRAMGQLADLLPWTATRMEQLTEQQLLFLELFTSRFAKLQDLMGTKLIHVFLSDQGEVVETRTMIDQLHLLERLGLLEDANIWLAMRTARNHIAHEYPDDPSRMAEHLNHAFEMAHKLLELLDNINHYRPRPVVWTNACKAD